MVAYFDNAATTPLRPEAVRAMVGWLEGHYGNSSGSHSVSRLARQAVEEGRQTLARALGAHPGEVIFTSGGTESDNLALSGVCDQRGGVPVCSSVEHHAVLGVVEDRKGRVSPVGLDGLIDLDALAATLCDVAAGGEEVAVVSVMLANNETGIIQPLAEVARVVRRLAPRAVLHTDAVQAFPWMDVAQLASPAQLVSVSAHKFGGPQGAGALVVRDGVRLVPLHKGGGQERDRRSGTHNVAGILGMAAAAQATVETRTETIRRVRAQRDRLVDGLLARVPDSIETGDRAFKTSGHAHLRFDGIQSEELLVVLDEAGICASAGSACASGALDPSHVLVAMGISPSQAMSSLRLSLGANTTEAEIDLALSVIPQAVSTLRARS
ncbi:MAG: cysteine desulfurase family protein [Acidimicrobiales bacterium]